MKQKQNNITNNITNNNNITCNIQIVAFGNEDLDKIPDAKIKSFINRGFMSVVQMVEYVNCNKDIPENNNIYVSNKRDNTIMVFNGEKWMMEEKNNTLDTILNKKGDFLEKKYIEYNGKLSSVTISKFEQFKKGRYNDEQMDFMKGRLNKVLYNNRDLATKNLKYYIIIEV